MTSYTNKGSHEAETNHHLEAQNKMAPNGPRGGITVSKANLTLQTPPYKPRVLAACTCILLSPL